MLDHEHSFHLLYEAIKAKLIANGSVDAFGPPCCCRARCILCIDRSVCIIGLTRNSVHSVSPHLMEGLSQWLQKRPTPFLQTISDHPNRCLFWGGKCPLVFSKCKAGDLQRRLSLHVHSVDLEMFLYHMWEGIFKSWQAMPVQYSVSACKENRDPSQRCEVNQLLELDYQALPAPAGGAFQILQS